jgi:hypothetical protein
MLNLLLDCSVHGFVITVDDRGCGLPISAALTFALISNRFFFVEKPEAQPLLQNLPVAYFPS